MENNLKKKSERNATGEEDCNDDSIIASCTSDGSCTSETEDERENLKIEWHKVLEKPENTRLLDDILCDSSVEPDYEYCEQVKNIPIELIKQPTPWDYFELFLPKNFRSCLAEETNRYAHQSIEKINYSKRSRVNNWKNITIKEIDLYLGTILWMGILSNTEIQGKLFYYILLFFLIFRKLVNSKRSIKNQLFKVHQPR